jgi:energy-coupling factor transporter ATP-binding protein EcfA2
VRAELPIGLKDQPQYEHDLTRLRRHSVSILSSISNTIGGQVRLPRVQIIDDITLQAHDNDIVVIAGEPMVGKSGLLKLLANRLHLEGEVFAFGVEEFAEATTLVDFLHNNGIMHDFHSLLTAVGNATLRCILIDGLERAITDNKRRVINDLLSAVRHYNSTLVAGDVFSEYRWRVVFTCRQQEMNNILVQLSGTRESVQNNTLSVIDVSTLTDEEIDEVKEQIPQLAAIVSSRHLKDIISRPLVLDILTLPGITLPPESLPIRLTETWLLDWFWQQVVRRADEARTGRGHPDARERLLMQLALQTINADGAPTTHTDDEALSGVLADRLLHRLDDGSLRFGHDVLEDWTLVMILRQHISNLGAYLIQIEEPLRLSRAFQLATIRLLEVQQDVPSWLALLRNLEHTPSLSPRWYRLAISALLSSDLIRDLLPRLQQALLDEDNALLCSVLRNMRLIEVQPDSTATYLFKGLPENEIEKLLAHFSIPIWKHWIHIIQFVLIHRHRLTQRGVLEFSYIVHKWLEKLDGNQLFREHLAHYALEQVPTFMKRCSWSERDEGELTYDEEKTLRNNFAHALLQAGDCLPNEVEAFVRQYGLRTEDRNQRDLEDVILREGFGWVPLCRYLPDVAVDILEGIICQKIKRDPFGGMHHLFMDLGIDFLRGDNPPTPDKGPFRVFIRAHENQGLELIHRIVCHATHIWILREQKEWGRQPVPQQLHLSSGTIEVWGDAQVYQWYRYPSVGPDTVTCALMALEQWMHEQIQQGIDPTQLFERVLRPTNSVALVGVCVSVALAHMEQCLEAMVPIITCSAFWEMDIARVVNDMMADSHTRTFAQYFSLGNDKKDYQKLIDMAQQPQRKTDIRQFVLLYLLKSPPDICERVQAAIRSFPENPPIYDEHERDNKNLRQSRTDLMQLWAAFVERENYSMEALDDESGFVIQFILPQQLAEKQRDRDAYFEAQNEFLAFQNWCTSFLKDGQIGERFSFDSALAYAQELVDIDAETVEQESPLFDSESHWNAIAMFVAALVLHTWDWVEQNNHIAWCREQLLITARRPDSPADQEHQRWEMGCRRSAARALPIFLSKQPRDKHVQQSILKLATHQNEEVRAHLFFSLSSLWESDSAFVWKCIDSAILEARRQAIRSRYRVLWSNPAYSLSGRQKSQLKTFRLHTTLSAQLWLANFRAKPLQESLYKDISENLLQSTIYAIPNDARITEWASGRQFSFLFGLVCYTVNNFVHFQEDDRSYNEWAHYDWSQILFPQLVNALLRLPLAQSEDLLKPILRTWEQVPSMLEELLRRLSLTGAQAELEERLIILWVPIAKTVLNSELVTSRSLRHDIREILGLIIFADPTGIVRWQVPDWEPLRQITSLIDFWVERVGHDPSCFPSLVRLLRSIGFNLMPEFGVTWLHQCLSQIIDFSRFFTRANTASRLAELLHDSWQRQSQQIMSNQECYRRFVYLVDRVADQGEQVAIRLQKQLQDLDS